MGQVLKKKRWDTVRLSLGLSRLCVNIAEEKRRCCNCAASPQQSLSNRNIGDPTLVWKVYNIESGKILKAGFETEDEAKDWLEARYEDLADEYTVEEMDADEEEEWREGQEEEMEAAPIADDEDEVGHDEDDAFYDDDDEESDEDSLEDMYEDEEDDED